MLVKLAMTPLNWTQPLMPHPSLCPQTLASAFTSPTTSKKHTRNNFVVCRSTTLLNRSLLFGSASTSLCKNRSCDLSHHISQTIIRRASNASYDAFSDEEFSKQIDELAKKLQISDDSTTSQPDDNEIRRTKSNFSSSSSSSNFESVDPKWPEIHLDPPDRHLVGEDIMIEWKANSVDLPLSLRMIKRKIQNRWQEGFTETAYCSVKKAFASIVFIIGELHSYTLQMRELLYYEDLQEILSKVQQEIHASFVWLFQQVFSHTPTFMVYVMILLANFTVHSMACNVAIAALMDCAPKATTETISSLESPEYLDSVSGAGNRKITSIGGNYGGEGRARPADSGTDGDGSVEKSSGLDNKIVPEGAANQMLPLTAREEESVLDEEDRLEELKLWDSVVDEASTMHAEARGDFLDFITIQRFLSPLKVELESDEDYPELLRTELVYRMALALEPEHPLLLANFAQFLYLVARDYDRAEEYFKKAIETEPKDAETCSKYAYFLRYTKKDLWAAEETYLEALSADPGNTYHIANYANFLCSGGAEDTCYPLDRRPRS